MKNVLKKLTVIPALLLIAALFSGANAPDEGQYPLSEISKLDLKAAGLKIDMKELYNPEGVSLVQAIVQVGGCTGSFVSPDGLILTNHHCAFDIIATNSTVENNILEKGFYASSKDLEIPAKDLTLRITESYEDVSAKIIKALEGVEVTRRTEVIRKVSREMTEAYEKEHPGIDAEISEMFVGQSYVMFKYRVIRDVRLVFAPPRSIGEFGGERDNWVWPRHTGDFSFLRAYVSPSGESVTYNKENVPFKPVKYLKVNANGVNEGDFGFILGYPGRTFRHQPAKFVEYHLQYMLPYISETASYIINRFNEMGKEDEEFYLKVATTIKGLANVEKNYRGKIQGLKRLNHLAKMQGEERELQKFIESDATLKQQYGGLIAEINNTYEPLFNYGRLSLMYQVLGRSTVALSIADALEEYNEQMNMPEDKRSDKFKGEKLQKFYENLKSVYNEFIVDAEKVAFSKVIGDAVSFDEAKGFAPFAQFTSAKNPKQEVKNFIEKGFEYSYMSSYERFLEAGKLSSTQLLEKDPLYSFIIQLQAERAVISGDINAMNSKLNDLLAKYTEVKRIRLKDNFIPDANSTLRLTYGYIRGYTPADAMYYKPITTLTGVMEKYMSGLEDYVVPDKLKTLYEAKDFGRYASKELNDVPVAILYNMDTTGGNSGSPVLNANGEIIGINFDRAFEATINDYAWSESYSRSIGADIRYVLWVTEKVGGAGALVSEMGVK